jgi:hypothetical protein
MKVGSSAARLGRLAHSMCAAIGVAGFDKRRNLAIMRREN